MSTVPALQPYYRHSWAVVVGINNYLSMAPLSCAVKDAEDVASTLIEVHGFHENYVISLLDEEATQERILGVFDDLLNRGQMTPDDRVIVFFAGHGITRYTNQGQRVGYIAPVESEPRAWRSLIPMKTFVEQARFLPAKHVLFILDACYSGLSFLRSGQVDPVSEHLLTQQAIQLMTSGRDDERVIDGGDQEGDNSLFTSLLLEGLRGAAATASGLMTASDLMRYIYRHMAQRPELEQTPQYGWLAGGGDLVFSQAHSATLPLMVEISLRRGTPPARQLAIAELASIAGQPENTASDLAVARLRDVIVQDPDPGIAHTAANILGMTPGLPFKGPDGLVLDEAATPPLGLRPLRRVEAAARRRVNASGRPLPLPLAISGGLGVVTVTVIALFLLGLAAPPSSRSPVLAAAKPTVTVDPTVTIQSGMDGPAPPLITPEGRPSFEEQFQSDLGAWERFPGGASASLQNLENYAHFAVLSDYSVWIARPENVFMGGGEMTLEFEPDQLPADARLGLVFGMQDFDNYYIAELSGSGEFSVLVHYKGGASYLSRGSVNSAWQQDAQPHRLTVERVGAQILVNFDDVQRLAVYDDTFGSGRVGVAVGTLQASPASIRLLRFTVRDTG